jgi:cobalt-zinc-cadmium efflux system outer membrane protein
MRTHVSAPGVLLLAAAAWCLAAPVPSHADELRLTLPQAVDHSLHHNGDLRSFREEQGIHDAGVDRAGLMPNPTFEVEGTTGAMGGNSDENSLSLGLSQEFPLAGKREKRRTVAERERDVYRFQLADRERLTALEVKIAYADLYLSQQRLGLAIQAAELSSSLLAMTKELFAAGDIPELEVNLASVEVARSESELIAAKREIVPARARLSTLMGLETASTAIVVAPSEATTAIPGVAGLVARARANRPDIKSLSADQARGEAEVNLARAESIPNLTLGFFVAHERGTDAIGADEEKTKDTIMGVRLSLPLPLFDRNQTGIREAGARRGAAEARLLAANAAIEQEVAAEHARLAAADEVLSLYAKEILPRLKENLALLQAAYGAGEADILAVIAEQKKYLEVHEACLEAGHARLTALARLEAAVGGSLDELTTGGVQ